MKNKKALLTAAEVIARAGLVPEHAYMQTDTGSIDTGEGWIATINDIYDRGDAAFESAFDPDGDGAHLVRINH